MSNSIANTSVYACMYNDEMRIITIISDAPDSRVDIRTFRDQDSYQAALADLRSELQGIKFSPQNTKLISYSRDVATKLNEGIRISIVDAQNDDNIIVCPCCGVRNEWNPAIPFCMECGETISK